MSDNYKPTVEVVRRDSFSSDVWRKDYGRYPDVERALLVRGVPMVGDEVEDALCGEGTAGVVEAHRVILTVMWPDEERSRLSTPASLRPATRDAEVDAEMEAMLSAFVDARAHKMSDRDIVKSVRNALDRVRGTE